jgi:hypothetical protein
MPLNDAVANHERCFISEFIVAVASAVYMQMHRNVIGHLQIFLVHRRLFLNLPRL